MAKGDFWFKFEWNAWLGDDSLSLCSLETQGFWIRCIAIMNRADVSELTGTVDQLCRQIGCLRDELVRSCNELKNTNSADVIICNDDVMISSRRRKKEIKHNEYNRLAVARHREKEQCNVNVRGQSKNKSKSKKEIREETPQAASPKKGTRLPDVFLLTSEMREYGKAKRPEIDIELETEKFCNFWRAKTGKDATKLNWTLTWKNWILNAKASLNGNSKIKSGVGQFNGKEKIYKCSECFDLKIKLVEKPEPERVFVGEMKEIPCPKCDSG